MSLKCAPWNDWAIKASIQRKISILLPSLRQNSQEYQELSQVMDPKMAIKVF